MENFIHEIIEKSGESEVVTRFPPEPNGYLHLGHVKSIHTNFETAIKYNGRCNLRFDDTNPENEDSKYVDAIKEDLDWLGYKPDNTYFASEYFGPFEMLALMLIRNGDAYVCELTSEEMKDYMGTTDKPAKPSPNRDRSIEDNTTLFKLMRGGKIEDGKMTLRVKIDLSSPNVHMRDPVIYRVKTMVDTNGVLRHIYPMYDFAHPLSDYVEGITHSLCTTEFEVHRPLYNWINTECSLPTWGTKPTQIEFARLNVTHTIMSKRKLKRLVEEGIVDGLDDPRLPTIAGLRRRGVPAEALKKFCETIGVTKRKSVIDMSVLDKCTRDVLNETSNRRMVVFDPLKVTITNWDKFFDAEKWMSADVNPQNKDAGVRMVNFGRNLLVERDDFMEEPVKKFHRLTEGAEVRFKYGYYVTVNEVIKDEDGKVVELLCTYDPETKGGWIEGRKVRGTIHWVNADNHKPIKVNLYDRLFNVSEPTDDFLNEINPDSIETVNAFMEAAGPHVMDKYLQFERNGYYVEDGEGVWNRTLPLRDGWKNK
jgi:glutaminyl-tRNA synthetase